MHLAYIDKDVGLFRQNEQRLLECYEYYKKQKEKMMWELLYGAPGFLYVFLELQKEYDKHPSEAYRTNFSAISKALTIDIIQSGVASYTEISKIKVNVEDPKTKLPEDFRLTYLFHKKEYLGGAHGLGGNINILLLSFELN